MIKRPPSCGQVFRIGSSSRIDILSALDHLLARCVLRRNHLGKEASYLGQHWKHLQLVHQAARRLRLQQRANAVRNVVERIGFKRQFHAPLAAELVHQNPRAGMAFNVLEQQRGTARLHCSKAHLRGAIGDLRHLQNWVYLHADALQLSGSFELLDPVA